MRVAGIALMVAGVVVLAAEWAIRMQRREPKEEDLLDLPSPEPVEEELVTGRRRMSWVQIGGACLIGFGFGLLQR